MTVLARRREVRKQAKEDGFYAVDFAFGPEEAMGAAMLVNTVPAPVVESFPELGLAHLRLENRQWLKAHIH